MKDAADTADKPKCFIIELEEITKTDNKQPENILENKIYSLPFYQPPRQNRNTYDQNYYYPDQSYARGQTPAYQQRVDGQPVYVMGGYPPPPANVSRGGTPYYVNNPNQPDDSFFRDEGIFTSTFDTVKIRNRFVQRVYTILSLQLFVTFGFIILAVYEKNTRLFFRTHGTIFMIVSMIVFFALYLALVCCVDLRRKFPLNFVMLGLLTLALTLLMTTISVFANTKIVMYAIATTALVCLLVSIFAIQTTWDVTGCGMCLCIAMIVLMVFGLIIMIMHLCGLHYKILDIVYSSIAALLFCFYLMYDTQQIVGGRRIEMSPEEYIFGALCLYIDIVYIFMHILMLYQLCLGSNN